MDEILSFVKDTYPSAGPILIILVLIYMISSLRNEAIEKNINEVTFNELIMNLTILLEATLIRIEENNCKINISCILLNHPRNEWQIRVFQKRKKYSDRLDFIFSRHISTILIFIFLLLSFILYKMNIPHELCLLIDLILFIIAFCVYLALREWFQEIKECFNSTKAT